MQLLTQLTPFAGAGRRRLVDAAAHTDRITLGAGAVLARRGDTARELVVVLAGRATAQHGVPSTRTGPQPAIVIGFDELVAGRSHRATVVADTDVEVLVVEGRAVRSALLDTSAADAQVPARRSTTGASAFMAAAGTAQ